ncbi:laminin subunit alpha-1-like protein, partial [Lates japonicus]
ACLPGFYRVGGVLFGGNCMQCECNDHATECDVNGVCLPLGCRVDWAAGHVAAASQDLCLSHVTRMDGVSVWRVWAETSALANVGYFMVSGGNAVCVGHHAKHAQCAAATWQELKRSSATQRWECATVDTAESVCARLPITLLSVAGATQPAGGHPELLPTGWLSTLLDTRQLNTSRLTGPLYWRLPPQFEGKQLLSYGGLLSYIITFYAEDGLGLSNQEPQVLMRGGTLKKLVIYTDMVAPSNGVRTQHDIRMTEHKWERASNSVSRRQSHDFHSQISNITMETVVEVELEEGSEVSRGVARLIESCICPPGHAGLSCQECAPGLPALHQWAEMGAAAPGTVGIPGPISVTVYYSPSLYGTTGPTVLRERFGDFRLHRLSGVILQVFYIGLIRVNSLTGPWRPAMYLQPVGPSTHCVTIDGTVMCRGQCQSKGLSEGAIHPVGGESCQSLLHLLQVDFLSTCAVVDNRLRLVSTFSNVGMETLRSARTHLNDATQRNAQTHILLDNTHTLLYQYQSLHLNLSADRLSVDTLMEESQLLLDDTVSLTEELTNSTTQVEVLGSQLDQWRPLLRKQVDGLVIGLKMTDALENVYRAESHAHLLQSHAHSLHSSLSSVCNTSQNGSRLAQLDSDITERVDSAQQAALIAHISASLALNMSVQSKQPLSEEGGAKLNSSSAVLDDSRRIRETAEDLQLHVSMATSRLGVVRESIWNSTLLLHQPIRELQSVTNGSPASLPQAQLQAAAVHSSLQAALQRLQRLRDQLQDSSSVVENTNNTVRETNELLTHTQTAANEAQRKLEEAEHRTEHLMERIKPLSMLGETLSRNLSDIRELIDQARRQAASIKVAVQADRNCVRSYRPQIQSSNFNTLSLILKTSSPENLLFYLGSTTTVDYLAVEMHDGKVSLLWDVGSGSSRLEFPGLDITNNRWTRINATRFGARVSLSVHPLDSESAPLPAVTAMSPGSSRVLDVNRNTVIHIGGLGPHTQ